MHPFLHRALRGGVSGWSIISWKTLCAAATRRRRRRLIGWTSSGSLLVLDGGLPPYDKVAAFDMVRAHAFAGRGPRRRGGEEEVAVVVVAVDGRLRVRPTLGARP